MDRITSSMIDEFKKSESLESLSNTELFEYFANYCVVNNVYGLDDFDIEDITTGDSSQGIDGIAIIINQRIIQNTSDIDLLLDVNKTLTVKFVLIQAKTSESFNNMQISNFLSFAKVFFGEETTVFHTPEMQRFIELKNYIFDHGNKLKKNPELMLYYVTLGTWNDSDSSLSAAVTTGVDSIRSTNYFSETKFLPIGAEDLQELYRKTHSKLTSTFFFQKRTVMYSSSEDEVGYCGVIPFGEFKKLLIEDSGARKPVFEDNIRDYLGPNEEVNKAIENTLSTGDINSFSQLNNGVTVVTSSINIPGDWATIEDYQIVNGCQTCNILLDNLDLPNIDELIIPIRIIATKDEKLKNDITRATNNQTAIKKEQLEALSTFQKNLEEYYKTYSGKDALVYERRSGQYRASDIPKNRIVSIPLQIKTVAAMFLNEPSAVSGQYGTVVKRVGSKIFKKSDKLIMYYVSAFALYRLELLFKSGKLDKRYRRSRYHIMMLMRMVTEKESMPKYFNSKDMENYCQNILDILTDETESENVFKSILDYLISIGDEIEIDNRKCFERKETTDYLISKIVDIKAFCGLP